MKKILALIIAALPLMCGTAFAFNDDDRAVNNFTCTDGAVTWSRVFQTDDINQAKDWFDMEFKITKDDTDLKVGETTPNALPIGPAGLKVMKVVTLLQHPCVIYFTAEFKEDRYRVTVNKIIWQPQLGLATSGLLMGVGTMDLNELSMKNGDFAKTFYNKTSADLDKLLEYVFTVKAPRSSNDNW